MSSNQHCTSFVKTGVIDRKKQFEDQKDFLLKVHTLFWILCFYKIACRKLNLNTTKSVVSFYDLEEIEEDKRQYEEKRIKEIIDELSVSIHDYDTDEKYNARIDDDNYDK